MKKLPWIFCDIDGTLLDSNHQLSKKVKQSVKSYINFGGNFSLATGKLPYGVQGLAYELELKTPQVCSNGGIILYPDGTLKSTEILSKEIVKHICSVLLDNDSLINDLEVIFYTKYDLSCIKELSQKANEILHKLGEPTAKLLDVDRLQDVSKVVFFLKPNEDLELYIEKIFEKDGVDFVRSGDNFFEIMPKYSSKGNAIKLLNKNKNHEIVCIGDSQNDISMFEIADIKIALQNSVYELKRMADFISSSNDNHGVCDAIEFVLKKYSKL